MVHQELIQGILSYLAQQAPDDRVPLSDLCEATGQSKDEVLQTIEYLSAKDCVEVTGLNRENVLCSITYTGRQF